MSSTYTKSTSTQTSHSETKGGSRTTSGSETTGGSSTRGGSKTTGGSSSRTYAAGVVDKNTQAQRNKYTQDYKQSATVTNAYNRLQNQLNNQPGAFNSTYQAQLDNIYDKIVNRQPFEYNFNADPIYQQYKNNYINQGRNAMKDTVATTTALTGGYSNSYAQTAGQQTYQQYLTELNNVLPQLQQQAYQRYQDEGNNLATQYSLASDRYSKDYQQYRDTVADYRSDRDYLTNLYNQERNFDYSQYTANRAFWNDEYWKQRNADMRTEGSNWSNTENWSDTSNWSKTNSWSNTDSWSTTDGKTTTSSESTSTTESSGGGGGGGGRKSSGKKSGKDETPVVVQKQATPMWPYKRSLLTLKPKN